MGFSATRIYALCFWLGCLCWLGQAAASDTSVLDKKLSEQVGKDGYASLSVGIVKGDTLVYSGGFGWADAKLKKAPHVDTQYRIGSITKVFTTTLLGILRDEGKLRLDDPIRMYLPASVKLPSDPRGDRDITFRHLATHTSGLPRDPVNLVPNPADPFGNYSVKQLYDGLANTKLVTPIGQDILYSNLGMGLLGHVLSLVAKEPYESLLKSRLFKPLAMHASTIEPTGPQFAKPYLDGTYAAVAKDWHLGEIGPAGEIGSNVSDMAKFLSLQLMAGQANVAVVRGSTLAELHRPQRLFEGWKGAMGLGWLTQHQDEGPDYVWHNGGLDGYFSYTGFSASDEVAVIVLSTGGMGADKVGRWLLKQAVQLYSTRTVDEQARARAQEMVDYFVAEPGDDLAKLFHSEFLKAIPMQQIKPIMANFYAQYGRCTGIEQVSPTEVDKRIKVKFVFEKGTVNCILAVSEGKDAKINYLLFP